MIDKMCVSMLPTIRDTGFKYSDLDRFPEHQIAYNFYKNNADENGEPFAENLNNSFRLHRPLGEMEGHSRRLDELIASVSNSRERVLYRATYKSFVEKQLQDGVIVDPGFLSTAEYRKAIVQHFNTPGRIDFAVLEIHCGIDKRLLPMDNNDENGYSEFEWLLPRNTKLEVLDMRSMTAPKWINELFGMSTHKAIKEVYYFETRVIW